MRAFFLAILCLSLNVPVFAQRDGKALPPPKPNLPWEHAQTSLRLPAELADLEAEDVFQFAEAPLGVSVAYNSREPRLVATVYVYPCGKSVKTAEEVKEAISETASQAVWEVEEMGRRGRYKKVQRGEPEYSPFDLLPENAGVSALLTLPMSYTVQAKDDAGKGESEVGSLLAIMVLRDHFIKVRLTYDMPDGQKAQEDLEKRLNDFVNAVRRCVLDTGLRDMMQEEVTKYRKDPLGKQGHEAAGGLISYAEVTPLITLSVDAGFVSMGEEMKEQLPEAPLELMRAFMVGAVAESLKKPGTEPADMEQGAAEEMLRTFAAMQKAHPKLKNAAMDDLQKAVNEKRAAAWFRARSGEQAKNKRPL